MENTKLLVENVDSENVPSWKLRRFWDYNIHPITGKREVVQLHSKSSKIDATAKRVSETHNHFVSMHI